MIVTALRGDALRMPVTPPLFAHCGVLRAAHWHDAALSAHTDVAADALADVLRSAFLDLLRQEGIGDGGTRGADEIQHAALYL